MSFAVTSMQGQLQLGPPGVLEINSPLVLETAILAAI